MKFLSFLFYYFCFSLVISFAQNQKYSNLSSSLSKEEALKLAQEKENNGDKKEASRYINYVASTCWENRDYDCAIQYFQKSMQLNQSIGNENGVIMLHNNLGMIYADKKNYSQAIIHFDYSFKGRKKTNDKVGMISSLINLSVCYNNLKQYNKAIESLEKSLAYASEMSDAQQMRSCYGMLAETHEKAGNSEKSRSYFELYRMFHEKVQKDKELKAKLEVEKSKFEAEKSDLKAQMLASEKKNKELELEIKEKELLTKDFSLRAKDEELKDTKDSNAVLYSQKTKAELTAIALEKEKELKNLKLKEIQAKHERGKIIQWALIGGASLLCVLFGVLVFRYKEKQKTNAELNSKNNEILTKQQEILQQRDYIFSQNVHLEKVLKQVHDKNEQITSSIEYAFRIQTAMLSNTKILEKFSLDDFFILWKPRDIVSGDFYWLAEKGDKIILTVADCTGHGVPGAFMSMIGDSLLNQIIHDKEIYEPNKILSALHSGVVHTLNQADTDNKDGMDITIITVDKKEKVMYFAGANNPIYYFQNEQFFEIKGNKYGIGGFLKAKESTERLFDVHTIDVSIPTQFYLFSDGFADQFGGEEGRKFMSKRFKLLLQEIHSKSAREQRKILNETIDNWMGHKEHQIDDILVVGGNIQLT